MIPMGLGHVREGHTNNKYYNTNGGQSCAGNCATLQHIVRQGVLMTVWLLGKSFICVEGAEDFWHQRNGHI